VAFNSAGLLAIGTENSIWLKDMQGDEAAYRVETRGGDLLAFRNERELMVMNNRYHLNRFFLSRGTDGRWQLSRPELIGPTNQLVGSFALGTRNAGRNSNDLCAIVFGRDGVMWDLDQSKRVFPFRATWGARGIAFSPNGEWFAAGYWNNDYSGGGRVHVFSARDGRLLQQFDCGNSVTDFSPDSQWLMIGTPEEHRQISTKTWTITRRYPIDGLVIVAGEMVFRQDGRLAALELGQQRYGLIDPASGESLLTLTAPVSCRAAKWAWSRDQRWLVHTDEQAAVLWDLHTLKQSLRALALDWE
jgi:hypothetical protein